MRNFFFPHFIVVLYILWFTRVVGKNFWRAKLFKNFFAPWAFNKMSDLVAILSHWNQILKTFISCQKHEKRAAVTSKQSLILFALHRSRRSQDISYKPSPEKKLSFIETITMLSMLKSIYFHASLLWVFNALRPFMMFVIWFSAIFPGISYLDICFYCGSL